jgi:hypothetical protein
MCLVKVLKLFLWHPILVLALGILGFVGKGAAPLVRQLRVEMAGRFFLFFHFPWSYGHLLQVGVLMWSHQVAFGSFCPQGRLHLGPEVIHCQFMQGVQNCCILPCSNCVALQLQLSSQLFPQQGGAI